MHQHIALNEFYLRFSNRVFLEFVAQSTAHIYLRYLKKKMIEIESTIHNELIKKTNAFPILKQLYKNYTYYELIVIYLKL